jgi:4-aminobutyrate aminotransferase/(S)-3-amino-2-methylpropionate transaminase
MRSRFEELAVRHPQIGDVRGLGPMLAVELVRDGREPDPKAADAVVQAALRRGLLILKAGMHGHCLRVLVALVATDEQVEESLEIFDEACAEALGARSGVATAAV